MARFSVEAVFKGIDKMSAPVSKIENRINKMTRTTSRGLNKVNRSLQKVNSGFNKTAKVAAGASVIGVASIGKLIDIGADFEQSITNAAAKFPGEIKKGTDAFKELEDVARKTGSSTEFSASQSADALNFLAMAGFNAEQSIKALPAVVGLATAAGQDLATATDIASDSLGAFNLMTKDSAQLGENLARVNDVIAKTVTTANTDVTTLFETIKDGAPVATAAGASLETFAALAGELANSGIKGSKAGTTLKNVFLKLAAPTGGAVTVLKRLGVQTKDANGDMRDVTEIIGDLSKSLDGLGTAERAGVIESIFGKIPIAGVNVLLAVGSKKLQDYRKQLENAEGAASKMATTMRDTTRGSINSLKSAIEGTVISIFKMNDGGIKNTIDRMTEWVRANEGLIASNIGSFMEFMIENLDEISLAVRRVIGVMLLVKGAVITFQALTVAIGVAKGVMVAYQVVAAALPGILGALRVAILAVNIAFAANPIGLIVTAIGLLAAGATALILAWDPVKEFFSDLWDTIKKGIPGLETVTAIASAFGFGSDDDDDKPRVDKKGDAGIAPISSPQDRLASRIEEKRETRTTEVTIKDESGKAEVTKGVLGTGLQLERSGSF